MLITDTAISLYFLILDVTVESLKKFIPQLWNVIYIECLFCGNLLSDDVERVVKVIENVLIEEQKSKAMLPIQHLQTREHNIPDGM